MASDVSLGVTVNNKNLLPLWARPAPRFMAVEVLPTPPFDVEIAILFNVYFLLIQLSPISSTGSQGKCQRTCGFGSAIFLDFL
jgi:hypothetical protein